MQSENKKGRNGCVVNGRSDCENESLLCNNQSQEAGSFLSERAEELEGASYYYVCQPRGRPINKKYKLE